MEPEEPAQPQESAGSETIQAWLRGHWLVVVVGGLFVLVFATILANLGGDEPEDLTPATLAEGTRTPPTQAPTEVDSHQIPPIDGCTLISDDEVLATLGVSDNTGVFRLSGGEGCVWQLDGGSQAEGLSVELVPGNPSDFATGAMLNDATGVPVPDIGDVAVWFGGKGAGTLSAARQTDIGYLFMRLAINRPDVDDRERLGLASSLITSAMDMVQFGPPPPVEADLCELVTDNEAEELLAPHRQGRAAAQDPLFVIENFAGLVDLTQPGDYSCTKLIFTEIYVKVESAPDSDFGLDANVDGVPGEPVAGVGDMAMWFENVPYSSPFASPHEIDVLSVAREDASFRIVLALPDLTPDEQFETASELARKALGRLPGGLGEVITIEPEPELVTFEEEGLPDLSHLSLGENLLTKEGRGEWTRGEGLVASLALVAGEVDRSQVLGQIELVDRSATLVIQLAQEYIQTGDDPAAIEEIEGLLDRLTLSQEELDRMSGPLSAAALFVSAIPMVQEQEDDPCESFSMENPCIDKITLPDRPGVPAGKYQLYAALSQGSAWTFDDVEAAKKAVLDSAEKYEPLGEMPPTTVVLQPGGDELYVHYTGDLCVAYVDEFLAAYDDDKFQQIIAREMAFCLIGGEFNQLIAPDPSGTKWWSHGLAIYLSGYVYPSVNLEHDKLPSELAGTELSTRLVDRTWTNWVFFEYLHPFLGVDGNLATIKGFPVGGDHIAALAAYPGMPELFHDFTRQLTDANVPDLDGRAVPYDPKAWDLPLGGPTEANFTLPNFGVRRIRITVPDGYFACFETYQTGEQKSSWRPGPLGEPGSWEDIPPAVLEGETILVLTAVEPGARMTLDVEDVFDNPDCEDEEEPEPGTEPPPENCNCDPSDYFLVWQDIPDILKELFPW